MNSITRFPSRVLELCRAGWARGRWQCLLAGIPLALIALGAALVLSGSDGLPGLPRPTLGHLMRLESYAAFTGFIFIWFLMVGGGLAIRTAPFVVWGGLAAIVAFMTWIMWSTRPGVATVLQYLAMVAVTYCGAFIDNDGPSSVLRWLPRVAWVVIAFVFTMLVTDTPVNVDSWTTEQGVMWAALIHFSLLAFMEFSGLYHFSYSELHADQADAGRDPVSMRYWNQLRKFAGRDRD